MLTLLFNSLSVYLLIPSALSSYCYDPWFDTAKTCANAWQSAVNELDSDSVQLEDKLFFDNYLKVTLNADSSYSWVPHWKNLEKEESDITSYCRAVAPLTIDRGNLQCVCQLQKECSLLCDDDVAHQFLVTFNQFYTLDAISSLTPSQCQSLLTPLQNQTQSYAELCRGDEKYEALYQCANSNGATSTISPKSQWSSTIYSPDYVPTDTSSAYQIVIIHDNDSRALSRYEAMLWMAVSVIVVGVICMFTVCMWRLYKKKKVIEEQSMEGKGANERVQSVSTAGNLAVHILTN